MNSLDELYDHDGKYTLDFRNSIFKFCERSSTINALRKTPVIHDWISFYFRERITVVYDLGRGFIILQKEDLKLIDELKASNLLDDEQKAVLPVLKSEIEHNIQMINNGIISEKDAEPLLENIEERADEVNSFSHTIPASMLRWMFFVKKREDWKK